MPWESYGAWGSTIGSLTMIYFDNAATSYPKPQAVKREIMRALNECGGNPGRGAHSLSLAAAELVYDARASVAELFGIDEPERVVFTSGATAALNLAIKTSVRPGMHVLISDREHNAVARPLFRLCDEGVIDLDIYPTSGNILAEIESRIRPATGLVVTCHVSNVTGFAQPVEAIGELCKSRGIRYVVDAAGSAGHLPIDLNALQCDALCAPGHKGLLGIPGVGIAILSGAEGFPEFIEGGSGVDSLSRRMPSTLPERYEAGTLPTPAIAALGAGIQYLLREGVDKIAEKEAKLRSCLLRGLAGIDGITVYEPENTVGPVAFTHSAHPPEELAALLDERGIAVRAGYHCAPLAHKAAGTPPGGAVRVSIGICNRHREIEELLDILRHL